MCTSSLVAKAHVVFAEIDGHFLWTWTGFTTGPRCNQTACDVSIVSVYFRKLDVVFYPTG